MARQLLSHQKQVDQLSIRWEESATSVADSLVWHVTCQLGSPAAPSLDIIGPWKTLKTAARSHSPLENEVLATRSFWGEWFTLPDYYRGKRASSRSGLGCMDDAGLGWGHLLPEIVALFKRAGREGYGLISSM